MTSNTHSLKQITTVKLKFITLTDSKSFLVCVYELSRDIQKEIIEYLELDQYREFVLSFSRFVDFDRNHHIELLDHLFNILPKNVERQQVSAYILRNPDDYFEKLELTDLIFLCAILHNLNLKKYLVPLSEITIKKYSIKLPELANAAKDQKYKMNIFWKNQS